MADVLVVGATGTVGREVVAALRAKGASIRALVRSKRHVEGCEVARGDLRDAAAVGRALDGVRAAFYVSPHEPDEEALADAFVRACEARSVRVVFVGVHVDGTTRIGRALKRFVYGRMLSHYRPKFRLSERVRRSGADPIVLVPPNFFQNDEIFRDEILGGVYPQPFERAINRVDVRDLGEAAARACLDRSLSSGAYPVVGPASLDGATCATTWSEVLGRNVAFDADAERFRAAVSRQLSGKKAEDFVATYAVLRNFAMPTIEAEVARTAALLGRPPTSYADYVRATAARWQMREAAE